MMQSSFSRNEILNKLHQGEVTVNFTKTDGSLRVMRCTLNIDLLPQVEQNLNESEKKERKVNLSVVPVFDLDAKDWRSFRVDSVKNIAFIL